MQRWGNQAPAACCGVCKPCVSSAATGFLATGLGLSLEARAARKSRGEGADEAGEINNAAPVFRQARDHGDGDQRVEGA
jgi:hypothetical protein